MHRNKEEGQVPSVWAPLFPRTLMAAIAFCVILRFMAHLYQKPPRGYHLPFFCLYLVACCTPALEGAQEMSAEWTG